MALIDNKIINISNVPSILALDMAGQPMRWITYQDSCYYAAKGLIAWTPTESEITIFGGHCQLDGKQSSLTMNTIVAIKGKVSNKHQKRSAIPPLTNRALFRRDKNICAYCGGEFSAAKLTRDHIQPTSRGGVNKWTNVVSACGSCNKHKDARTPEEANMKLLYVPYAPNRAEFLILQNRKILADQMDFLMKQVPAHSRLHAN